MKGIVFTEFLELVEDKFGLEIADSIIESSAVPSGGVYTSVGTYDHQELIRLLGELSKVSSIPIADSTRTFGEYLFGRFVVAYPQFFEQVRTAFDFLASIENYIHVEVRKLYPEAELPRFECRHDVTDRMEMVYRSARPLADFAEGLIAGCIKHFGEQIDIAREDLPEEHGTTVRFTLTRMAEICQ